MEFHFTSKLEEYYQKFVELQEKLKKSEEERFLLEMKFNEMVQVAKEEEQAHYKKLMAQYKRFLEEDKKRQDRNERIIRNLERVETRISMLSAKTERINILRRQYQNFLLRISGKTGQEKRLPATRERSFIRAEPLAEQQSALFRDDFSLEHNRKIDPLLLPTDPKSLHQPEEKRKIDLLLDTRKRDESNEEKIEILDRYLQSISSQKCRDLLNREKEARDKLELDTQIYNGSLQPTNHATAVADDIMNSIYSRYYNKNENKTQNGTIQGEFISKPVACASSVIDPVKVKDNFMEILNSSEQSASKDHEDGRRVEHPSRHQDIYISNEFSEESRSVQVKPGKEDIRNPQASQPRENDREEELSKEIHHKEPEINSSEPKNYSNHQTRVPGSPQAPNHTLQNDQHIDEPQEHVRNGQIFKNFQPNQDQQLNQLEPDINSHPDNAQEHVQNQQISLTNHQSNQDQQLQQLTRDIISHPDNAQEHVQNGQIASNNDYQQNTGHATNYHQLQQLTEDIHDQGLSETQILEEHTPMSPHYQPRQDPSHVTDHHNEENYAYQQQKVPENQETDLTFVPNARLDAVSVDQSQIHYEVDEIPVAQSQIHYENNAEGNEVAVNQPQVHNEENAEADQVSTGQSQIGYEEAASVPYDHYDQQYDQHGNPLTYDQNGQPLSYDQNAQLTGYDQYLVFDQHGQVVQPQYDNNGQIVPQYDEQGQLVMLYDQNGQPYFTDQQTYDGNVQYDENGQAVYSQGQVEYDQQYLQQQQYQEGYYEEGQVSNEKARNEDTDKGEGEHKEEVNREDNLSERLEDMVREAKVMDILDTDTENSKKNTSKISDDTDFDFS